MTTSENTVQNFEGPSKSELIRQQLRAGIDRVSEIRKALEAQGVEVSENLIHTVKAKMKVHVPIAPGVIRVHREGQEPSVVVARSGSKKEAIIALYHKGVTKASEIKAQLAQQGIETSINNVHVTLAALRGATPKATTAPTIPAPAPAPKKPSPKVIEEGRPLNPDLVTIMQAAALQYGSDAVTQAAEHVSTRSREMIRAAFA